MRILGFLLLNWTSLALANPNQLSCTIFKDGQGIAEIRFAVAQLNQPQIRKILFVRTSKIEAVPEESATQEHLKNSKSSMVFEYRLQGQVPRLKIISEGGFAGTFTSGSASGQLLVSAPFGANPVVNFEKQYKFNASRVYEASGSIGLFCEYN